MRNALYFGDNLEVMREMQTRALPHLLPRSALQQRPQL